ncbi:MAG: SDR family oxidoreductase [Anaerolineales bacterium]|nr:SDR family oxidoreductase [Anaerolineales bacterium]
MNKSTSATSPVLLITGASSGIGAATARLFASQGYRLVLAARRLERLQALAGEIQAGGGQALPIQADLGRLEDIQELAKAALEGFGQVNLLFNNAGFGRLDWLEELHPRADVQEQLQVNLSGSIWLTQAILPHMVARRQGHIINMCSVAGLLAPPTYSVYAASKFGLRGFSQALGREVGVYGVHVSVIYPGGVATEFSQRARIRRKTGSTTPAWLRLSAEQVAQAVLNLARRPRRSLVIPWPMRLAVWANELFPGLVDQVIERKFVRPERS